MIKTLTTCLIAPLASCLALCLPSAYAQTGADKPPSVEVLLVSAETTAPVAAPVHQPLEAPAAAVAPTTASADPSTAEMQTLPSQTEDKASADTTAPLGMTHDSNATALKAIEKNMFLFTDRIKERFAMWLERSSKYMEIMKGVLKEKQAPEELVFLPFVESGFNVNAYSRANAVGPWQFIAATGKRYGLVIDWWRDERKDPVKSTGAAAEYLKDLYKMFGSWKLALAAYNAGEGRIAKALRKSGADDYWSLLKTQQIRNETKEYVPRYIAASRIANTPENYGFSNLAYHKPMEYDTVTLDFPVDIDVIAECAGVDVKVIRELNPELRRWSTPANVPSYEVRVPFGTRDSFIKNLAVVPEDERFTVDTYHIKKGDSLKKIAKKAGVPVNAILAMNQAESERSFVIKTGAVINLPPKDKYVTDLADRMAAKKVAMKTQKKSSVKSDKSSKSNKSSKKATAKRKAKSKSA